MDWEAHDRLKSIDQVCSIHQPPSSARTRQYLSKPVRYHHTYVLRFMSVSLFLLS